MEAKDLERDQDPPSDVVPSTPSSDNTSVDENPLEPSEDPIKQEQSAQLEDDPGVECLEGVGAESYSETQVVAEKSPSLSVHDDYAERRISQDAVDKLTYGLLAEFLPELQKSKATLIEVTENQRILIESLQQENAKFDESEAMVDVQRMMSKAKLYHNKLLSIRKDMVAMHEKSAKLKKRALKLQQQKHKQILQEEQERERQLDREQQLVAKLATAKR